MTSLLEELQAHLPAHYRIDGHLADGGMAVVFRATDLKHERQVAVKVLRPELSAMVGADRFLREIQVTAQLQHPHILPLYDSGVAGDPPFWGSTYQAVVAAVMTSDAKPIVERRRTIPGVVAAAVCA